MDVQPLLESGRYVVITVTDWGAGIADPVLPHVLEPFFTTKPEETGTGLGIAMVDSFAEQSGGGVQIASKLGARSRFSIYLPATEGPAEVLEAQDLRIDRGRGESILLVDDDIEILEPMRGPDRPRLYGSCRRQRIRSGRDRHR